MIDIRKLRETETAESSAVVVVYPIVLVGAYLHCIGRLGVIRSVIMK